MTEDEPLTFYPLWVSDGLAGVKLWTCGHCRAAVDDPEPHRLFHVGLEAMAEALKILADLASTNRDGGGQA